MTLTYNSCSVPAIRRVFTIITTQNLGFKPQNMMWGDSMSNKGHLFIIDLLLTDHLWSMVFTGP